MFFLLSNSLAFASDECASSDFLLQTKSADGNKRIQRISLGDKHDFVVCAQPIAPGTNSKSIYFIEKFARLFSFESRNSTLRYDVQLPAGTIAIDEHNSENGFLRIAVLAGRVVFVNIHKEGARREFSICGGQEICVAEPDYSETLLIPSDGVDREPLLSPGDSFFKMAYSKYDQKQMLMKDPLLAASSAKGNNLLKVAKGEINKAAPLRYVPRFADIKNPTVSHHSSNHDLPQSNAEAAAVP